jgi:hypothetical protein
MYCVQTTLLFAERFSHMPLSARSCRYRPGHAYSGMVPRSGIHAVKRGVSRRNEIVLRFQSHVFATGQSRSPRANRNDRMSSGKTPTELKSGKEVSKEMTDTSKTSKNPAHMIPGTRPTLSAPPILVSS